MRSSVMTAVLAVVLAAPAAAERNAAARVYVGNSELFRQLRALRPDVQELFCPGTILNPQRFMKTDVSVFTRAGGMPRDKESSSIEATIGPGPQMYATWSLTSPAVSRIHSAVIRP